MPANLEPKYLKKGKSVDNFFKNLAHEPCAISVDKMHQVSRLIKSRDLSANLPLLEFIKIMTEKIDEYDEASENFEEASPHLKEKYSLELEFAQVKTAVCICVLAKYFYPVIEQLERLVDDGIKLEKELKGKNSNS